MSVVLQISDLHFGTERPPVMRALQSWVRTETPDLLIVSGDITQRARRSQFRAAAEFIETLPVPARLIIPGNHDIPLFNVLARLLQPFGNFQRVFGGDLAPEFESDNLLVLCVNSARPERHKHGVVSAEQIERVAVRLRAAAARQLRLVVMHHPVLAINAGDQNNLVRGHANATRIWAAAGVDLILGGHIHLPYVRPLDGGDVQLPRDIWTVQAGTTISRRVRGDAANSFNVIRSSNSGAIDVVVERWDYDIAAATFALAATTVIAPDRAGARK